LKIKQEILCESIAELNSIAKMDKSIMDELKNKQIILYETINELHATVKMDKSIVDTIASELKNIQIDLDYIFTRIGRKHKVFKSEYNDSK